MNMHIKTTVQGCHVVVNIKIGDQILLSLTDNDEEDIKLLSGITYRFEWFVWTAEPATAIIQAEVLPANDGFLPLIINKNYPPAVQDGNAFLFTLN